MKKGTPVWGLNRFRSTVLPAIIKDLESREDLGLLYIECELVRKSLKGVVDAINEISDGGFLKSLIYNEMSDFLKIYVEWNGPNNNDPGHKQLRIKSLNSLRKKKNAIIRKIRKNQNELVNEKLDKILIKNLYGSFGQLIIDEPEIFSNVTRAIKKFNTKNPAMSA